VEGMILLVLPLSLLLIISVLELARVRDLLTVVVLLSVYSGIVAVSFAVLGAVDVSYTEAVVGSSISTILLMLLLSRVDPYELSPGGRLQRVTAGLTAAGVALVLFYGMLALPRFGDPDAPPSTHVSPYYTENSVRDSNTPNTVTAVLTDYRGFDTLIETVVVLTAALACMLVIGAGRAKRSVVRPFASLMLSNFLGPLIASLQLFLFYVIMHGHYSPGGAFQGGTLLACSFILPLLANAQGAFVVIGPRTAIVMAVLGVIIFAGVGVTSMLVGRPLLDYGGLPFGPADEPGRRALGTLLIEVGVALTVAGSLVSIYYSLERGLEGRQGGSS
jgi:multicomponent Na+:H+ antiporter subunit B